MEKFLGLKIREKPLSDSQYVEQIRKRYSRQMRTGKWFLLLGSVGGIVFLYIACRTIPVLLNFAGPQAPVGLAIGGCVGMTLGFAAIHVGEAFAKSLMTLKGDRTVELLLKYHDALLALARLEKQPSEASQDDGPSPRSETRFEGQDPRGRPREVGRP